MPNSKKICRIWGKNFFAGEVVMYRRKKWRIIAAPREDVPRGRIPIEPEDKAIKKIVGIEVVPIDDIDRLVRQSQPDQ